MPFTLSNSQVGLMAKGPYFVGTSYGLCRRRHSIRKGGNRLSVNARPPGWPVARGPSNCWTSSTVLESFCRREIIGAVSAEPGVVVEAKWLGRLADIRATRIRDRHVYHPSLLSHGILIHLLDYGPKGSCQINMTACLYLFLSRRWSGSTGGEGSGC